MKFCRSNSKTLASGNEPEVNVPSKNNSISTTPSGYPSTSTNGTMLSGLSQNSPKNKQATAANVRDVSVPAAASPPALALNHQDTPTQRGLRRTADEWQAKLEARQARHQALEEVFNKPQAKLEAGNTSDDAAGIVTSGEVPTIMPHGGLVENREQQKHNQNMDPPRNNTNTNTGSAMARLRGLRKNRELALNALPNRGLKMNSPSQRASLKVLQGPIEEVASATPTGLLSYETSPTPLPITPSEPSPPIRGNSCLAVAKAVENESASLICMEAQQIDPEVLQRQQINQQKRKKCRIIGCFIIAICCIGLSIALGVILPGKIGAKALPLPTQSPTMSLESHVLSLLPEHTLIAMDNDQESPQARAYE